VSLVALFTQYAYAQVVKFAKGYFLYYAPYTYMYGRSAQQTSDGGYIITGNHHKDNPYEDYDTEYFIFLIKTDAYGDMQWAKSYRIVYIEIPYSVRQTSDGGYIVAGYVCYPYSYCRALLIKTDANGNVQWAKTYGGTGNDGASSVQQTSDGGYIVAGNTASFGAGGYDVFLIKTDANGNVQWAKTYGGTNYDGASSVRQTSDGGYIVAGSTISFGVGGYDVFLIKTDANGNVQWAKTYGGTGHDWAYSVQQTSDGGYILAGGTSPYSTAIYDVLLIKTDANGNVQWAKTYNRGADEHATSVQQTSDGGYIVTGRNFSLLKTDANGNVQWAKYYSSYNEFVQQTSDGGYMSLGSFGDGPHIIKTDANGNIGSSCLSNITLTVSTPSLSVSTPYISSSSPSLTANTVYLTFVSTSNGTWVICPLSDDNELGISESCKPVSGLITPYKGGIKITKSGEFEVKVYNVGGVMVKSVKGKNEVKLELSRGVYFVEVVSDRKLIREKVVVR
jgi:hypothetical protein